LVRVPAGARGSFTETRGMMYKTLIPIAATLALVAVPALADDAALRTKAENAGLEPIPLAYQRVDDNELTQEKLELGWMLFFDPRISASADPRPGLRAAS
jgi:cytochrome c peroxidase